MKKEMIRKLLAVGVLACAASVAQAAVVDTWVYEIKMEWVNPVFNTSTDPNSRTYADSTLLSWGASNGLDDYILGPGASPAMARSSLKITDPLGTGQVATGGSVTKVNMFRHVNNAIYASYADLLQATLRVSVNLFDTGVPVETLNKDFKVYFYETPNTGQNNCGWGFCDDDLFAFVVMPQIYDVFTYNGVEYTFNYFQTSGPNAIQQFSASVCSDISRGLVKTSCYGFQTKEGAATTLQFGFSITAVPEPETYAMLLAGLGLVGVVVRRRRGMLNH